MRLLLRVYSTNEYYTDAAAAVVEIDEAFLETLRQWLKMAVELKRKDRRIRQLYFAHWIEVYEQDVLDELVRQQPSLDLGDEENNYSEFAVMEDHVQVPEEQTDDLGIPAKYGRIRLDDSTLCIAPKEEIDACKFWWSAEPKYGDTELTTTWFQLPELEELLNAQKTGA